MEVSKKKKNLGVTRGFSYPISISRILYQTPLLMPDGGHLSGSAITRTLERYFALARDTTLHSGKDLAVSPHMLPCGLTHEGCPILSFEASLLAPLKLLSTGVTRYLPAWLSLGECSDFPLRKFPCGATI